MWDLQENRELKSNESKAAADKLKNINYIRRQLYDGSNKSPT